MTHRSSRTNGPSTVPSGLRTRLVDEVGWGRTGQREILLPVLMVGNVFTLYLLYLELAVIHIICPLCVSLYVVNYALTIIAIFSFFQGPDISEDGLEAETTGVTGSWN